MLLIYSGRDKFLDTRAQRYYTPFLTGLSTTCGVILICEAQYVDYVETSREKIMIKWILKWLKGKPVPKYLGEKKDQDKGKLT